MRKIRILIIAVLLFLGIMAISTNVQAASTVTLQKVELTSPTSGTCKTGDEITIVATFSGNVEATAASSNQKINILFGTSTLGVASVENGVISGNTVTFKYTIQNENSGDISLKNTDFSLKDGEGNFIDANSSTVTLTGNKIKANPFTWADTSNVKIAIDSTYNMKVTGLTSNEWYAYVVNGKNAPTISQYDMPTGYTFQIGSENGSNRLKIIKNLELSGDIYVYIVERKQNYETNKKENKIIVSDYKVDRPAVNTVGSRIEVMIDKSISSNDTKATVNVKEPHDETVTRKCTIKVGRVTDKNVLSDIKNGSYASLLTYAKSSTSIYSVNFNIDKGYGSGAKTVDEISSKLTDKAYYYLYVALDDENGKYCFVEDVGFAQASYNNTYKFGFLTKTITWDESTTSTDTPSTSTPTDSTVSPNKIPQTGTSMTVAMIIAIAAIATIVTAIKVKKYNLK